MAAVTVVVVVCAVSDNGGGVEEGLKYEGMAKNRHQKTPSLTQQQHISHVETVGGVRDTHAHTCAP